MLPSTWPHLSGQDWRSVCHSAKVRSRFGSRTGGQSADGLLGSKVLIELRTPLISSCPTLSPSLLLMLSHLVFVNLLILYPMWQHTLLYRRSLSFCTFLSSTLSWIFLGFLFVCCFVCWFCIVMNTTSNCLVTTPTHTILCTILLFMLVSYLKKKFHTAQKLSTWLKAHTTLSWTWRQNLRGA